MTHSCLRSPHLLTTIRHQNARWRDGSRNLKADRTRVRERRNDSEGAQRIRRRIADRSSNYANAIPSVHRVLPEGYTRVMESPAIHQALDQLRAEQVRLERRIAKVESILEQTHTAPSKEGRKGMGAEERKAVSGRMKKYGEEKRRAKP